MSDVANANIAVRKDRLRVACFRLVVNDRSAVVVFSEVEQLVAASSCVELSLGLLNDMLIGVCYPEVNWVLFRKLKRYYRHSGRDLYN
jgi:hypothetical protein